MITERRKEYKNHKQQTSYRVLKDKYIKELGGTCVNCGSMYDLEFDHIDPSTKIATITKLITASAYDKLKIELDKCQLLCYSCHKEKTRRDFNLQSIDNHGTIGCYKHRRCRCDLCRNAQKLYMQKYRKNRNT